jgi:hypothetical protein
MENVFTDTVMDDVKKMAKDCIQKTCGQWRIFWKYLKIIMKRYLGGANDTSPKSHKNSRSQDALTMKARKFIVRQDMSPLRGFTQ